MVKIQVWQDGSMIWRNLRCINRANGPAIRWADGTCVWYWHGREVTEYEHMFLYNSLKLSDS